MMAKYVFMCLFLSNFLPHWILCETQLHIRQIIFPLGIFISKGFLVSSHDSQTALKNLVSILVYLQIFYQITIRVNCFFLYNKNIVRKNDITLPSQKNR